MIVDVDEQGVGIEIVRIAYDVARAGEAIRQSSLPNDFASYLENGGQPSIANIER